MKGPEHPQEEQRLEALRQYKILDTETEQIFDDIAELAACICDVPIATISLVDADRQWFKSKFGIEEKETARDISFCTHTILGTEPMIVRDATSDSRFAQSPLVMHQPGIRFYAGFPLSTSTGMSIGALCAIDRQPRSLTDVQERAMTALSRQLMQLLELRRVTAQLADALEHVKVLHGLLPICAWCNKIRDDAGTWNKVEAYLKERSETSFTHSICPDCMQKVQAEHETEMISRKQKGA